MQQTSNYALPQWEQSDAVKRADFNDAMSAIDAALMANADAASAARSAAQSAAAGIGTHGKNVRVTWGSYVGDGQYGKEHPIALTFDFRPVIILITEIAGTGNPGSSWLVRPNPYAASTTTNPLRLTWSDKGVSFYNDSSMYPEASQNNTRGFTYNYVALGYDE